MIDESKRNLRVRKNPKYLNSDQQDPDKVSFSQLKSHHEYSSAYNQKVQDSKILAKFINKVNKSYRTYLNQIQPNAIQLQKPEPVQNNKKNENQPETSRKSLYTPKQNKKEPQSKYKSPFTIKTQYPKIKQQQTIKNTQSSIYQFKHLGSFPPLQGIEKGLFTDQLKKLQTLYPDMKNISYQTLTQNTNPNLFGGSTQFVERKKEVQQQKNVFAQQKLFKRSAYHVAIAYHIYLKNLKEKGGVIGNQIDPTYYAKKLKEGKLD